MGFDEPMRAVLGLTQAEASDAARRFSLYNSDVEGALESHKQFIRIRDRMDPAENGLLMFYASMFVCAVRRTGRLLESLSSARTIFRPDTAETIRLEWRKKRTFYEAFVEPRNAIEHIDSEAKDLTKWRFFNLINDRFEVTDGIDVEIGQESACKVQESRDRIARAIIAEYDNALLRQLRTIEGNGT